MLLPNPDNATIDSRKLADYVLNAGHPEGRHKARVFMSALGVSVSEAQWLANAIRHGLKSFDAVLQSKTEWGSIYAVDMEIIRDRRCAKVRTGWLCSKAESKLVTCYVIGECNEAT